METSGRNLEIAEKLRGLLAAQKDPEGTAASAALIMDGQLLAACAVGTQDGDPAHPAGVEDLYNVGSVSKVYCAMAVMKLAEMGKVTLDTPVCRYLPRFTMKDPRYTGITLRMCLNHSSGLPGTGVKNAFRTQWMDPERFYDDYYDYLRNSTLKAEPGAFSVYCNDGFTLAELVVAQVSGMSFTSFVQEHITIPAGLLSTCSGESNPQGRTLIREKGKKREYLMVVGAGGISSDLADCARFGYLFLDPRDVFTRESVDEAASHQGISFLPNTFTEQYGLGWDLVDFKNDLVDFGDNMLVKSGGTGSFSTYLVVIPKYHLAAAMSATNDTKIDVLPTLCQLCAAALGELGIKTLREESKAEPEQRPVPAEVKDRFEGVYFNANSAFRVEMSDTALTASMLQSAGWTEIAKDLFFDGVRFVSKEMTVSFDRHGDSCYLTQETPLGRMPMAQKSPPYPPLTGGWKARVGKSYILCDGNPRDLNAVGSAMLTIAEYEDNGMVFLRSDYPGGMAQLSPSLPKGDDETEMFLNGPGSPASRDAFAPFVYTCDGVEHLYSKGFRYRSVEALEPLAPGKVTAEKGEENKAFRITAGKKLDMKIPEDVTVVMMDRTPVMVYHSAAGEEMPETCDGYLLFINAGPMEISVDF